jgi:hypothetical protein
MSLDVQILLIRLMSSICDQPLWLPGSHKAARCPRASHSVRRRGAAESFDGSGVLFFVASGDAKLGSAHGNMLQPIRCVRFGQTGHCLFLAPNAACELDVFDHDRDALCMDGAEIHVLEEGHEIGLCCFLQRCNGGALESTGSAKADLSSVLKSWAISRTSRWKGSFRISSSVDFWYLRISRRATVPGLRISAIYLI